MALERGKLSNVVQVAAGTTVGIVTVASSKKVYIKSIIAHAAGVGVATATAQVYFCPVGVNSSRTNKIFDVDIQSGESEYYLNHLIPLYWIRRVIVCKLELVQLS